MAYKERELADIAEGQWGLVTAGQARQYGVTAQNMAQMAKAGKLVRLAHGVYRLAGSPIDRHEDLRVAWLALDPGRSAADRIAEDDVAMVSHRSAALVLELGDLDADVMEFTAPQRRQTRRTDVRLHRAPTRDDWTLVDGLPVATPRRTIADLADAGIDRGHLATIVRDAMIKYGLEADAAASALTPVARRYGGATGNGRGLLTTLVQEAGVPRSTAEVAAHGSSTELLRAQWATDPELMRTINAQIQSALSPEVRRAINTQIQSALSPDVLREIVAAAARAPAATQPHSDPAASQPRLAIGSRDTKRPHDSGDDEHGVRPPKALKHEEHQTVEVEDNDVGLGKRG